MRDGSRTAGEAADVGERGFPGRDAVSGRGRDVVTESRALRPEGAGPPVADGVETPIDDRERLQAQLRYLTAALEDIVTLALSSADYKERAIMMHRRAVAALSSSRPPSSSGARR